MEPVERSGVAILTVQAHQTIRQLGGGESAHSEVCFDRVTIARSRRLQPADPVGARAPAAPAPRPGPKQALPRPASRSAVYEAVSNPFGPCGISLWELSTCRRLGLSDGFSSNAPATTATPAWPE